jgi:hypothetical protein
MGKDGKHDKEKDYNYALMGLVLLVAIIGLMMALWVGPVEPITNTQEAVQPFNYRGYAAIGRCADYDTGKNYYVARYVTDKDGIHNDECLSQSMLREYYCVIEGESSTLKYADYKCPYGCEGGACKSAESNP